MNGYEEAKHYSHKNKRKWCKGKPGVLHDYYWMLWGDYKKVEYLKDWELEVCSNCGKTGKWGRVEVRSPR